MNNAMNNGHAMDAPPRVPRGAFSLIIGRHATEAHLVAARQQYIGLVLSPTGRHAGRVYRVVGVRIDELHRLIAEIVRVREEEQAQEQGQAEEGEMG